MTPRIKSLETWRGVFLILAFIAHAVAMFWILFHNWEDLNGWGQVLPLYFILCTLPSVRQVKKEVVIFGLVLLWLAQAVSFWMTHSYSHDSLRGNVTFLELVGSVSGVILLTYHYLRGDS